jgi:regulator of replication initiation timing
MPLKGAYSEGELVKRIARAEIKIDQLCAENERLRAENSELKTVLDAMKVVLRKVQAWLFLPENLDLPGTDELANDIDREVGIYRPKSST